MGTADEEREVVMPWWGWLVIGVAGGGLVMLLALALWFVSVFTRGWF
jgi:hypothetical protein